MDCPNCGVYNPEDREICWRCNTELPQQEPKKRRDNRQAGHFWLYVAVALFVAFTFLRMCGVRTPWTQPAIEDIGRLPARSSVVRVITGNVWE